jgi:hypothetical protein
MGLSDKFIYLDLTLMLNGAYVLQIQIKIAVA